MLQQVASNWRAGCSGVVLGADGEVGGRKQNVLRRISQAQGATGKMREGCRAGPVARESIPSWLSTPRNADRPGVWATWVRIRQPANGTRALLQINAPSIFKVPAPWSYQYLWGGSLTVDLWLGWPSIPKELFITQCTYKRALGDAESAQRGRTKPDHQELHPAWFHCWCNGWILARRTP
jgi:hypothetical protein